MPAFAKLIELLNKEPFQTMDIVGGVDTRRRFPQPLDPEFPLLIRHYSFPEVREAVRINWLNWHDHFELFFVVEGKGRFRMGDRTVDFSEGDLLLVDNLKLHGFVTLKERRPRALVLYFLPRLVYTVGSPICDYDFLAPFYNRDESAAPVLKLKSPKNRAVCESFHRLLADHFGGSEGLERQVTRKLRLLDLLHELGRHLPLRKSPRSNHAQQDLNGRRMSTLFNHIEQHFADKITRKQAASMVHLSESRFHTFFQAAAGTNFVQYLTHVRVCQAARLLTEASLSVAEIAYRVGFSDQSYFDKRFKEHFQMTPLKYRQKAHG
jgi:AraC-like DNA-binding protein